jgi:hypothetical protein
VDRVVIQKRLVFHEGFAVFLLAVVRIGHAQHEHGIVTLVRRFFLDLLVALASLFVILLAHVVFGLFEHPHRVEGRFFCGAAGEQDQKQEGKYFFHFHCHPVPAVIPARFRPESSMFGFNIIVYNWIPD